MFVVEGLVVSCSSREIVAQFVSYPTSLRAIPVPILVCIAPRLSELERNDSESPIGSGSVSNYKLDHRTKSKPNKVAATRAVLWKALFLSSFYVAYARTTASSSLTHFT